ncbi:MAG: hypothetical protein U5L45_12640 [Saprospiraceae bacterium]|nr:hypothetical protein [Saprospiraceae bacterium]
MVRFSGKARKTNHLSLFFRERSERVTKYLRSGHNLKTSFFD